MISLAVSSIYSPLRNKRLTKSIVYLFALLINAKLHAAGPLGTASDFNAFVESDFTASATDIQGALAAGGNVNLTSYGIASNNNIAPTAYSLIAGGGITYTNGKVFHGSIIAGGNVSGISAAVRSGMSVGSSVKGFASVPVSFVAEFANLRQVSQSLALLKATATIEYKWGGVYVVGDCASSTQVLNLDGVKLKSSNHITLQCIPANATVIINISGVDAGIQNISLEPLSPYKTKTIFNFYEAKTVTFSSVGIKGSVLAPLAVFTNPTGHIDGTLIAKKWSGPMELHHFPFVGSLQAGVNNPPRITSTPVFTAFENQEYGYDVEAADDDIASGDKLNFTLDVKPDSAIINATTGLINWTAPATFVASVPEKNSQCYITPLGPVVAEPSLFDFISPLNLDKVGKADLRVGDFTLTAEHGTAKQLSVTVTNRGLARTIQAVTLAIYDGATSSSYLLGKVIIPVLAVDGEFVAKVDVPSSGFKTSTVYAELQDAENLDECEIRNNKNTAALFRVNVKDLKGLSDSQIYVLNVRDANEAPKFVNPVLEVTIGAAQSLTQGIEVSDVDIGDAASYRLIDQPLGVYIDARTGRLRSDPLLTIPGDYIFTVEIKDLRGATAQQIIKLTIQANEAPVITSTPSPQALEGEIYNYAVKAQDPNNDILTFGFTAPFGAMNPQVGVLGFTGSSHFMPVKSDNMLCEKAPSATAVVIQKKWDLTAINDKTVEVYGPVLVGQLSDDNGDGKIDSHDDVDVIFHNRYGNALVAVTGKTGALLWTNTSIAIAGLGSSALGDIDNDGLIDIVSVSNGRNKLIAFDNKGNIKWSKTITAPAMTDPRDAIAIADVNHDGVPEIIHGRTIYNNQGVKIAEGAYEQGGDPAYGIVSIVADLDLDKNLDVIAGRSAYDNTGKLLWRNTTLPTTGFNAVGNFNGDDFPEVVFVGGGRVALLDHTGKTIWNVSLPGGGDGGAPTIADMDGDGQPEIGVAGGANYVVFEGDGKVKWKQATQDLSSHRTGSSVFDFNGDGRAEVVYADEKHLFVFDGETGAKLLVSNNFSGTTLEYPVIADIDGDNEAEIIYGGNESTTMGLYAVEAAVGHSWAPTRAIWNQHSYHISNINDDGSIPQFEQPSWLTHNTYRLNTFADRKALMQPDISVVSITYDDKAQLLTAEIRNRGQAPIVGEIQLAFSSVVSSSNTTPLGVAKIIDLPAGAQTKVSLTNIAPNALGKEVGVTVTSNSLECVQENNQAVAQVISVNVKDPAGLKDTQTYLYSTISINKAPRFISPAMSELASDLAYNLELKVDDADKGDLHRFHLISAPNGVRLNQFTGQVTAAANNFIPGIYEIRVGVTDSVGAIAEQVHILTVSAPNNAKPVFTSEPPTTAVAAALLTYKAEAQDPDADEMVFSLSESPVGMYIDGITGTVYWTPTFAQVGRHIVDITVIDARGASESQRFMIEVTDPNINNQSPSITSKPSGLVTVGKLFEYAVIAVDPDGDALTYAMSGLQPGMALTPQGVFTWLPSTDQVNKTFSINFMVNDGRGGQASQSLTLPVNEAANNPPTITSVPSTSVMIDTLYNYQVVASDSDGDALSYQLVTKPNGMVMSSSGLISWTPSSLQANQLVSVEVRAIDARGAAATQRYQIAVNMPAVPNEIPKILSNPTSPALVGKTYLYQVNAFDPDGDALTYSLTGDRPEGLSLDATGLLSWAPTAAQVGIYSLAIKVSDGKASITQSYKLRVEQPADLVNNYPDITSIPTSEVKAGASYVYQIIANDKDNDPLTYSLIYAPVGMSMDAAGRISWVTSLANLGAAEVSVGVSDGKATSMQSWSVSVADGRVPLSVNLSSTPTVAIPGQPVTITLLIKGGSEAPVVTFLMDGVPTDLDAYGQAVINFTTPGAHTASVTVTAGAETKTSSTQFLVKNTSDITPPVVNITAPTNTQIITKPTAIVGTVKDENLISYEVLVSPKDKKQWERIAVGATEVTAAQLAMFDPTLMQNGIYDVLLTAKDVNGAISTASTVVVVDGDMKVGNYAITFEDVSVELAGIPIRVMRTYDTRQKNQKLDFGYGWSVDYQNVRIQESRKLGFSWNLNYYKAGIFGKYCLEPSGSPMVSVTLPNGSVERFKAKANPDCTQLVPTIDVAMTFEAMSGTRSTLEQTDHGALRLANGNIIDMGDENSFEFGVDPNAYKLTTKDGMVYFLDQGFGIRKIQEPGGQFITYTAAGIKHSLGYEVKFERDSLSRITALVLPDGRRVSYGYSTKGDLASVTDLSGNTTTLDYWVKLPHYLTEITDPRGVKATRMEYDDDGRLTAVIDADGNRIDYYHDITGRTEVVRDLRGNNNLYVYDDEGRVLSETNALGETKTRTYNAVGDTLSETNALGETTSWTYDTRGNQLTETDPLGNITQQTYNTKGQALTEKNALGITVYTNVYNASSLSLTSTKDALGNVTSFQWDTGTSSCATGASKGFTDALGNKQSIEVLCAGPKAGLPNKETNAEGVVTSYTYDSNGRKVTEKTTRTQLDGTVLSLTTSYAYDSEDRVIKTTHPDGSITRTEYNSIGKVSAEVDAIGQRTAYTYDARGNETGVSFPDGTSTSKTYDAASNLLSETDAAGNITRHEYDAANRKTATVYADTTRTTTEYNAAGRVVAEVDAKGKRTEYGYDAAGRRTSVKDALGNITTYEYDAAGRTTAMVDALNRRTTYSYNARDQRIKTTYADGSEVAEEFDAVSRRSASVDQAGTRTAYGYDKLGRLTSVDVQGSTNVAGAGSAGATTDTLNQVTAYGYDESGNKTSQTDAEGRITLWDYNLAGQLSKRKLPLGQSETFTYNTLGQPLTKTDFNGAVTTYGYDEDHRLSTITYADTSTESLEYDALGNRTKVTQTNAQGNASITTWEYNSRNRLVTETQANGAVLSYTYDANGNRTQVKVVKGSSTQTTTYTYDALNRLSSVTDTAGLTSYGYDAVGNRTSVSYPNGTSQVYSYNSLNRLTKLQTYGKNGALVEQYDYTLNTTGQRTNISELDGRTTAYSYDALKRLTGEEITDNTNGNRTTAYTYDKVGNRLTETVNSLTTHYAYDNNDRITSAGSITYTYDANGNTLTSTGASYTYNAKNQLQTSSNAQGETKYAYNADGIRTQQTQGATSTTYVVDSNQSYAQVLSEISGSNTISYTYGDDLISQNNNGQMSYYHYDGLGSTRQLSNAAGTITDSYDYQAFGKLLNQTGNTANSYLFTGEQFDKNLDQYYLRARYYNQNTGRFTQMDTYAGSGSDPVTLHKYLYANVNPVSYTDPSGNMSLGEVSMAGMALGALAVGAVTSVSLTQGFGSKGGGLSNRDFGWLTLMAISGSNPALSKLLFKEDITKEKEDAERAGGVIAVRQAINADKDFIGRRAVIGENQLGRVVPAAAYLRAITIMYTPKYTYSAGELSAREIALSIAFNYGWVKMLMVENFEIYDIGRDPARLGSPISPWYAMESLAVRDYEKHYRIKWQ